jgi:hypothetical protein
MTKEELEKEIKNYIDKNCKQWETDGLTVDDIVKIAVLDFAEPRETRIVGLEAENEWIRTKYDVELAYVMDAEPREKRIAELEAQIEKMKNCKNCANYMISGKCPCFFRTGWCKNWEMTRSKK